MIDAVDLDLLEERCARLLVESQAEAGGYQSISSFHKDTFREPLKRQTTFYTSCILAALGEVKVFGLDEVKKKAAQFLLNQKSISWSYNYWARDSEEAVVSPYPDDLDDTCLAAAALCNYQKELVDGEAVAKIVTLLTLAEEKEGGPYYTWLIATVDKAWRDVDIAVNSNIGYFLSLQKVALPDVDKLIEKAIDESAYASPYYASIYSTIYFIARWYRGNKKQQLIDFILARRDALGGWENPLYAGLVTASLLRLGYTAEKLTVSIDYLVKLTSEQLRQAYPFVIERVMEGKALFSAAPPFTAAVILEASALYKEAAQEVAQAQVTEQDTRALYLYGRIIQRVESRFANFSEPLRALAMKTIAKTIEKDKDRQMALFPYYSYLSLGNAERLATDELLIALGAANFYGWMAYTIYDDFLDEEGQPEFLPLANVCLRELTLVYAALDRDKPGVLLFFSQIMDALEAANTWETSLARARFENSILKIKQIPDYGDLLSLSDRSLGHALGPLTMLHFWGYTAASPEAEKILTFFRHYIVARQLNDDVHDWEADLGRGHITSVVALILKAWQRQRIGELGFNKEKDLPALQNLFWFEVVADVSRIILAELGLARQSLKELGLVSSTVYFERLLIPLEQATAKVKKEQEEVIKFLRTYKE